MSPMSKLPYIQFFTGDWLKDPALRLCSPAARGAWIDMLCLMAESDSRGILRTNGVAWTEKDVARVIGIDPKFILELVQKGVCRKAKRSGTLFSARMVRDEVKRHRLARNGQKGGKSSKQHPEQKPSKPQAKSEQPIEQNPKLHISYSDSEQRREDSSSGAVAPDDAGTQPVQSKTTKRPRYSEQDLERAARFRATIERIEPEYYASKAKPPDIEVWANEFRLIREADKRTDQDIESLIVGLPQARFWSRNVRAPSALRGKLSDGRDRFHAILTEITQPPPPPLNGHAHTGKRNYCPTAESDAERRRVLGIG